MRNRGRVEVVALAFVAAATFGAGDMHAGAAEVPAWVPQEYARFFHRRVDERPAWQKALGFLDISVGDTGPAFALVAGVSKYPKMGGGAGDLWPARLDVEKIVAYLEREPESFNEVVVLLDDDMTAENLGYFLTQYFPRRLSENPRSRFLFAYSGHGMTAANGRGYILTSQAKSLDDRFDAGISLATLRAQFQEIVDTGHQVLALINACYGVDFHRLSLAFGPEVAPLPQREGAHAITAGGAGEVTWHDPNFGDGDGPKGSIFFEAVLAALDGRADQLPNDGIVTVGELETYLRTTVSRFTDEKQNPTGGDLISTRSPGGFFFLDRNRQAEQDNATPLDGEWWGPLSFGGPADVATTGTDGVGEPAPTPDRPVEVAVAATEIASLVGHWAGDADEPGGLKFKVELEVLPDCAMNRACGWIAVPHVPCRGRLTLIDSRSEGFEFQVDEFDADSNRDVCQPGAGELLQARIDGTLSYTATYSGARGLLKKVE
jgi:hypothetical protein